MEFNIQERLVLVNLLPEKGNFETMSIIESLRKILYPSEDEVKKFEIKQLDTTIQWNKEGSKKQKIELTDGQLKLIKKQFNKLDEKDELSFDQYSLYKSFKFTRTETE